MGDCVWAGGSARAEVRSSCKKFTGSKRKAESGLRPLKRRKPDGVQADNLWHCYAETLAETQKNETSGLNKTQKS